MPAATQHRAHVMRADEQMSSGIELPHQMAVLHYSEWRSFATPVHLGHGNSSVPFFNSKAGKPSPGEGARN
jgi:hypothetical protein